MASAAAARRWKHALFVVSAYRVHKEALLDGIARLGRNRKRLGEGGPVPTFFFHPANRSPEETRAAAEVFLDHVMDNLEHLGNVVIDADHAKLQEADTESLRRLEKTKIAWMLRDRYIRQRNAFVNLYDEDLARLAGFEKVTGRDPAGLMFQVRRVVNRLKGGRVSLRESFGGLKVDAAPYGRALEPLLRELEAAVLQVGYDARTTEGRLQLKMLAFEAFDEVFAPAARLLEAAFRLAGMPELAELVKPVERRRREGGPLAEQDAGPEAALDAPDFALLGLEEPALPGEPAENSEPGDAEDEDPNPAAES